MTIQSVTGPRPGVPWSRADHMAQLGRAERSDLVVIGGGIVGAGVALDAATRGLSVVLAERADFAAGTSSRSTKLLHGGIRYLPQLRFGLVAEGLREQQVLSRVADYLYRPLEFVIPIYRGRGFGDLPLWLRNPVVFRTALRLGLWFYDLAAGRLFGPGRDHRHRAVTAAEVRSMVPVLRPEGLQRGYVYSDAETDDARLVIGVLKTAVAHGALAINRLVVTGTEPADGGYRVWGRDNLTGDDLVIDTRAVVAATGVFASPAAGSAELLRLTASKGVHLVVAPHDLPVGPQALVLPETDDERVLYVVPWHGSSVVGTTDTPYGGDPAHPAADDDDVDYLLRHVHRYLDVPHFSPVSTWAGLRALVADGSGSTAKASREHRVVEVAPGWVQVAGGKLTGYRRIAAEATKKVARRLGAPRRSTTAGELLVGAGGPPGLRERFQDAAHGLGLDAGYGDAIHGRYGGDAALVLDLLAADASLRHRLPDDTTLAEVLFAIRREGATDLSDFTLRRTHLSWLAPGHGRDEAELIAEVMGRELGWDPAERAARLEAFEAELAAEAL